MAVRVTVIEAVDDKGRQHFLHIDPAEADGVKHRIFSAAAPCLDPETPVCVPENAVLHRYVANASRNLGSDRDGAVPVLQQALPDNHLL